MLNKMKSVSQTSPFPLEANFKAKHSKKKKKKTGSSNGANLPS